MKIIAFAGSSSQNSINKQLATYAASLFENSEAEVLDLNQYTMPLYSVDSEKEIGQHNVAKAFIEKIAAADVLIVSLAEHNGNYATAFKNTIDWCSRIDTQFFQQKPMLLLATSPGPRGAITVLDLANSNFPRFGAAIKGSFSLPSFNTNFDTEKGEISNPEYNQQLKELVAGF
jgi:NAD(P)H-dependent FMN reductase